MSQVAFTAPHAAAAQTGLKILQQGGSAVDAMVAAAATIAVVYPHMSSLGGDGFWQILRRGDSTPTAIDAAGMTAASVSADTYHRQGLTALPARGGLAAVTSAGVVDGWRVAREYSAGFAPSLPLSTVFADAISIAEQGVAVTESLAAASNKTFDALCDKANFATVFLPHGKPLKAGERLALPGLARLLNDLSSQGLRAFYEGDIANTITAALSAAGSPVIASDLAEFTAQQVQPLAVKTQQGQLFNLPAPTQGVASLIILALYDRLVQSDWSPAQHVHCLIECTKQAFKVRNRCVTDSSRLPQALDGFLTDAYLAQLAAQVDLAQAMPWPHSALPGDTVWLGCVDKDGTMVSYIQSLYWEFGSGVTVPDYDLLWNNRGIGLSLNPADLNVLAPKVKPFHTLNPAMAVLNDGRRLSYGCMGGEGQPQTQAALVSRFIYQGMDLAQSIASSRWLLGRTWGDESHNLKLEQDMPTDIQQALQQWGHDTVTVPACNELMGHAGAVCYTSADAVIAATDPRSDGAALVARV